MTKSLFLHVFLPVMERWRHRRRGFGKSSGAMALTAILVAAMPARAADDQRRHNEFEITPFVGYLSGGDFEDPADNTERDLDDAGDFGIIFNAAAAGDYWRHYELLYAQQGTQLSGVTTPDVDVKYLQIGGIVSNPDAVHVIPYFGLTIGGTQFSPDEIGLDDETKLSFSVAGGLRIPITDHFGLRFDVRAFVTLLDSDGDLFCVSSSGLTCRIRAKSDTFVQYSGALGFVVGF
jgi:hypothetical protein